MSTKSVLQLCNNFYGKSIEPCRPNFDINIAIFNHSNIQIAGPGKHIQFYMYTITINKKKNPEAIKFPNVTKTSGHLYCIIIYGKRTGK